jgi:hypothetical protein
VKFKFVASEFDIGKGKFVLAVSFDIQKFPANAEESFSVYLSGDESTVLWKDAENELVSRSTATEFDKNVVSIAILSVDDIDEDNGVLVVEAFSSGIRVKISTENNVTMQNIVAIVYVALEKFTEHVNDSDNTYLLIYST